MKSTDHKQFRCSHPGCDKVFNRRDYLERHATNHLSVKPYVCVQCNRHFSRKDLYDNHLTTKRHARVTQEVEMANYEHHFGNIPPTLHEPSSTGSIPDSSVSSGGSVSNGTSMYGGSGSGDLHHPPHLHNHPRQPLRQPQQHSSHKDITLTGLRGSLYSMSSSEFDEPSHHRTGRQSRELSGSSLDWLGPSPLLTGRGSVPSSVSSSCSSSSVLPPSISPQASSLPFSSYSGPSASVGYRIPPHMSACMDAATLQTRPLSMRSLDARMDPRRTAVSDGAPIEPHPSRQSFLYDQFEFGDPLDSQWQNYGRHGPSSLGSSSAGTGGSIHSGRSGSFTRAGGLHDFGGRASTSSSDHARFSSYGVSLGLNSASSRTRSEGSSISDEYGGSSSESDSGTLAALVTERIRQDMAKSPVPAPYLRESQQEEQANPLSPHTSDMAASSGLEEPLHTPADTVISLSGDKRYAWFFNDKFQTDSAKLGYDRCYSLANDQYVENSDIFDPPLKSAKRDSDVVSDDVVTPTSIDALTGSSGAVRTTPITTPQSASVSVTPDSQLASDFPTPTASTVGLNANLDPISRQPSGGWSLPRISLSAERATQVLEVLREVPDITTLGNVEDWIYAAWARADVVKHIVHPATFDGNHTHLALLAVLALVGMALSENRVVAAAARRAHPAVFLFAYEALEQIPCAQGALSNRLDLSTVNRLQAVGLLLRYERLILIGDSNRISGTRNISGQYVTDLFLGKVLASVPHIGEYADAGSGESTDPHSRNSSIGSISGMVGVKNESQSLKSPIRQPIWATLTSEAYMFHQGADPELQWREWVLLECVKRTAHLSLYCDAIVALSKVKPNPVSIFNMDIHMVCPEPLWRAPSAQKFLDIAGPTRVIANVPYLGLIKSLIRFPRVAQSDDTIDTGQSPWSIFALKAVAHGLIMLVGKLSGLIPHGDEMLQAVIQSRSNPSSVGSGDLFSKFDRHLQARLYRGLDVWHHYFTVAYGDVMKRIMRLTGSMSISLGDTFDAPTEENEEMPQYALVIVLCHYSSFIFVHEDLPVVLQVTTNLKQWLETSQSQSLQVLLDYLYMPLYTNWIHTSEAKGMVSAATLYLAWTHAATGQVSIGNHLFLSAMIYISVIVVWLYDFANSDGREEGYSPLRLDDFAFMDDAIDYVHEVYKNLAQNKPRPKKRAVTSLILLSACLLYKRKSTEPLVEMLLQLLSVMDGKHSAKELAVVVEKSHDLYNERMAAVHESRCGKEYIPPTSNNSSPCSQNGDSEMTDASDTGDNLMSQVDAIVDNPFS